MIRALNISKSFGLKNALDGISFEISAGEYVALLGVNGAGKTTLVNLLATLMRPTKGEIFIAGFSGKTQSLHLRRNIGVMSHAGFLYNDLSAEENLHFYGRMFDVPDLKKRAEDLLRKVGLYNRRDDRVRTFSRGMQQRLSLARTLLHNPAVLLLDEPFAGLDIHAADMLKRMLDELIAAHHTVLLTVHDIDYALEKTQRILILRDGKLVADLPTKMQSLHTIREELAIR
ncbi:MAG: heme ABC exporter ATP-binding protein CcmA [Calditrichaeota bacterium]|nr:MAG: heme ABC exporter ATP-binding protein CcmA [Calditrichota bacterium]